MHELSLIQSALEIAEEEALRHGANRIHVIKLRIGRLAGVEPHALDLAFSALIVGTAAEGAKLEIETVDIVCRCSRCGATFTPSDFVFCCPTCGELCSEVRGGREIEVASLELS